MTLQRKGVFTESTPFHRVSHKRARLPTMDGPWSSVAGNRLERVAVVREREASLVWGAAASREEGSHGKGALNGGVRGEACHTGEGA